MNSSYNYSDFIGLSLESNDDYEPYGYDMETLQTVETAQESSVDRAVESILVARGIDRSLYE